MNGTTTNPPSFTPSAPPLGRENAAAANPSWKSEITARVRAHRGRLSRVPANQPALPGMEEVFSPASAAARVAERYSRLPSWREMLEAQAVTALPTIDLLPEVRPAEAALEPPPAMVQAPPETATPTAEPAPAPNQPYLLRYSVSSDSLPAPRSTPPEGRAETLAPETAENIPNPTDPLEEALVEPARPLPASVIAWPREIVARRPARPRLAEGPLREDPFPSTGSMAWPSEPVAEDRPPVSNSPAEGAEFELAAAEPEAAPAMPRQPHPVTPEWLSIQLDTEARAPEPAPSRAPSEGPVLHVASLEDRAFAALIDCAFTLSAFLLFSIVFALCSTSLPHGRVAVIAGGVTLFAMWLLYQLLFFSLTDATPGMRYVRIALCTFNDENPTRAVLRGRIAAVLLSALPLGLGFLWAVFDEDSLGWHDRITQTYQRSYREK